MTNTEKYIGLPDEQVVMLVRGGDMEAQDYLLKKYKKLVVKKANNKYFILGADKEDVLQEGSIGLFKAIRDYKPDKKSSFFTFAELCIERQIITAVKSAGRQKHQPLNTSLSLNNSLSDINEDYTYLELLSCRNASNPETLVIGNEDYAAIRKKLTSDLSGFEQQVMELFLKGNSYTRIASALGREEKSVDNALQRIKKKLERIVKEKNK